MKNIQRQSGREKKQQQQQNTHKTQWPPGCYTGKAASSCCAKISGEIWDSCNTNSALLQSQLTTWTGAAVVFTCAHSLQFQFWLVNSYILFRLDYCNSLLTGYQQTVIKPLQQVQNSAVKLILKSCSVALAEHTKPLLKQLHWLPKRKQHGGCAFCFSAVQIWNSLPFSFTLCHSPSLPAFKTSLK